MEISITWFFIYLFIATVIGAIIGLIAGLTSEDYSDKKEYYENLPDECDHNWKLMKWDAEHPAGLCKSTKCDAKTRAVGHDLYAIHQNSIKRRTDV
tara:strand:+ start:1597 stop:1884 length:288 start_codon:yes stop_codon:yes gene_type:complete